MTYKSICGGRKVIGDNEIGELTSPNYPHESVQNGVCHWILSASSPDKHISFIFTHIESHMLEEQCSLVGIELRDGDTNQSPLIGRYCGSRVPPPIVTEGSALFISKSELIIFRATYSTSTSHCGGDFTGEQGYFMSPVSEVNIFFCILIFLILRTTQTAIQLIQNACGQLEHQLAIESLSILFHLTLNQANFAILII